MQIKYEQRQQNLASEVMLINIKYLVDSICQFEVFLTPSHESL